MFCVTCSRAFTQAFAALSSFRVSEASILKAMQSLPRTLSNLLMRRFIDSSLYKSRSLAESPEDCTVPSLSKSLNLPRQPTSSSSKILSSFFTEPRTLFLTLRISLTLPVLSCSNFFGAGAVVNKGISLTRIAFALIPVLSGSTVHIMWTYLRDSTRIKEIRKRLVIQVKAMAAAKEDSVRALSSVYFAIPLFSRVVSIFEPASALGTVSAAYKLMRIGQHTAPAAKKKRLDNLNQRTSMYSSGVVNSFIQLLSR